MVIHRLCAASKELFTRWQIYKDPIGYARSIGVRVGQNCRFIGTKSGTFGSEPYLINIGNHVTLTHVQFITHDGGVWIFRDEYPDIDVISPITVGNNVFIGMFSLIMPGVSIGDNCVIGAGSVVTRDIPSNYIAVGVPAKCLKTVDEYWLSVQDKAFHIRSLPLDERRAFLMHHFGLRDGDKK